MSNKTVVYSQAISLLEYDADALKRNIIKAVLSGQPITDAVIDTKFKAISRNMEAVRKYAKKHYTLGLPNASIDSTNQTTDTTIQNTITEDLSLPHGCIVTSHFRTYLDINTIVLPFLIDTRGYDLTGKITEKPDDWILPETYDDEEVHCTITLESVALSETDSSIINLTYEASLYYSKVVHYDTENILVTHDVPLSEYSSTYTETYYLDPSFRLGDEYYVAQYRIINAEGTIEDASHWWFYFIGSGVYPALDPTNVTLETNNSFPVVPIRYENQFISSTNEPDIYTTGSKMLSKMGISFDTLVTKLDENPNITDIDNAYTMHGVDLQTENPLLIDYLIRFFSYIIDTDDETIFDRIEHYSIGDIAPHHKYNFNYDVPATATATTINRDLPGGGTTSSIVINPQNFFSLTEYGLKTVMGYDYITSYFTDETIGAVGATSKEIVSYEIIGEEVQTKGGSYVRKITSSKLILRKQVAVNLCQKVTVTGLVHVNNVYHDYCIETTPLDLLDDPDNHNLVIPLHYATVQQFNRDQQNEIYSETFLLIINGYERVHIHWYETGLFQFFVQAIVMFISAFTMQPELAEFGTALTAAESIGTQAVIQLLVETVFKIYLKQLIIGYAVDTIIHAIGETATFIAAVVTTMAGLYSDNIKPIEFLNKLMLTAEDLIFFGSTLISSADDLINEKLQELGSEYTEFLADAEIQQAALDAKLEALDKEFLLDPSLLLTNKNRFTPDFYSKPDDLYNKVHIGNIGTLSLNVVENFHTAALLLPEPAYLYEN